MKGFRRVAPPLRFAAPCDRPAFLPQSRKRQGAKAAGLRYEALVASSLGPSALHGQWFRFIDADGEAWCQPDFIMYDAEHGCHFVLEAKLSWVPEAAPKLRSLYLPVVEKALGAPVLPIVVCRNIEGAPAGQTVLTLFAAKSHALSGACPVLLWLGPKAGQLVPHKRQFRPRGANSRLTSVARAR